MKKIVLKDVSLDQTAHYYRRGSVLGGTIKSGCSSLEVDIAIDSDESADVVAELVRVAREGCYTHGTVADPVEVATTLTLRGQRLEIPTAPREEAGAEGP